MFLEEPSSSIASLVVNIFLALTILFASITNALETVDELYLPHKEMWMVMDTVVTVIFTLELLLRFFARMSTWKSFYTYIFSFYFIVDVMAIMPFYLELFHVDAEMMSYGRLAGLRSVRVFRLFKAFRFVSQVRYIQASVAFCFHGRLKNSITLVEGLVRNRWRGGPTQSGAAVPAVLCRRRHYHHAGHADLLCGTWHV